MINNMNGDELITITEPKPYQVVQRNCFDARFAHANNHGGASLGIGRLKVAGELRGRYTVKGRAVPLKENEEKTADWQVLNIDFSGQNFTSEMEVPAGGWYRLELSISDESGVKAIIVPVRKQVVILPCQGKEWQE